MLIQYGKGQVYGYVATESISLDGSKNLTMDNFTYLSVEYGSEIDVTILQKTK